MLHPSIINGKLVKSKACSSSICQNVTQKVYFLSSPLFEIIIHSPSYKNDFTGYFVFHKTGCQCLLSCRTERKFEVRPWFYLQKISSFCLNFFFTFENLSFEILAFLVTPKLLFVPIELWWLNYYYLVQVPTVFHMSVSCVLLYFCGKAAWSRFRRLPRRLVLWSTGYRSVLHDLCTHSSSTVTPEEICQCVRCMKCSSLSLGDFHISWSSAP